MAFSKFLILSIFLSLLFVRIRSDEPVDESIFESEISDSDADSPLKIELNQLKSKISILESSIEDRTLELKHKDESIARMEKVIQEKSDSIASVQSEIESIQKKGTVDVEERVGKAYARANELEKQVEKLKNEVEVQHRKKNELESRAIEAEQKMRELNLKLENLQVTNDEQKSRIRKTERALRVAEEALMKAQLEATSKTNELMAIHGAWLPPWFATHLVECQSFVEAKWIEYGKPALDVTMGKVSEKSAQAQKWAEPHLETVRVVWIPVLKEQWLAFTNFVGPHVQSVATKTVEVYGASKNALTPHIVKIQEVAHPYFEEAKKFSKPYIDQVATVTKPHVDKARVALRPYTKIVVHTYGKFLKSASTYHHQVQASVQETLKKHEHTKPLATKELVWFMASALLALPVLTPFILYSTCLSKKASKPTRNSHTNHAHRRPNKRRHVDK